MTSRSKLAWVSSLAALATWPACSAHEPSDVDAAVSATAATAATPATIAEGDVAPDASAHGARYDAAKKAIDAIRDRFACNRVTGCPGLVDLMQFGPDLVDPAADALARPDRGDNYWTVMLPEVLGQTGDPRATAPLVKLLGDKHWEMQIAGAIGLAHLGEHADGSAKPELLRLAALPDNEPGEGGDLGFRVALELALMRIDVEHAKDHREALRALVPQTPQAVANTPPPILDVVVQVIGHGRISEALPVVRGALATGNRFVVATALDVAGKLQDNGSIPVILTLLEDQNPTIRKLAFATLTQITGATFGTADQWRAWAARVGIKP